MLRDIGFGGLLLAVLIAAFWKVHSDLKKLRVEMSHQLNRDLLSKRFTAYADLWSSMQLAAKYTVSGFGPDEAKAFLENLTKWYFSPDGGLYLTSRAREFYFCLQELLRAVGHLSGWRCNERPDEPEKIFVRMLKEFPKQDEAVKCIVAYF